VIFPGARRLPSRALAESRADAAPFVSVSFVSEVLFLFPSVEAASE